MNSKNNARLAIWQKLFFDSILEIPNHFSEEVIPLKGMSTIDCLRIYQNGYKARLTESLGETFEACWWVLGDRDYFEISLRFIQANNSKSYDLSDYGCQFPSFLRQQAICKNIPFLPYLAEFELLFKESFHSPNQEQIENNLLAELSQVPSLKLVIPRSVKLWKSPFLTYEIWKRRGQKISQIEIDTTQTEEHLVIRKFESHVHVHTLSKSEFNLLGCFFQPSSLEEAVEIYQTLFGELESSTVQNLFSFVAQTGCLKPQN